MLFPLECFTCGKPLARKVFLDVFEESLKNEESRRVAVNKLGLKKMCCRNIFLTYPLQDDVLLYKAKKSQIGD